MQQWGPAGGGIWAAPTIDPKRNMVYVATGNNYADPSQPTTDAVLAFDMNSGTRKWVNQLTPNDNWTLGCGAVNPDNPNCPEKLGPDYDFSASPSLVTINGRDLLVVPQKSGMAYALDPDPEGQKVWENRIGQGSGLGGQWGGAVDGQNAYFGVSDLLTQNPGGMRAVDLATGKPVWSVGPQTRLCDAASPRVAPRKVRQSRRFRALSSRDRSMAGCAPTRPRMGRLSGASIRTRSSRP